MAWVHLGEKLGAWRLHQSEVAAAILSMGKSKAIAGLNKEHLSGHYKARNAEKAAALVTATAAAKAATEALGSAVKKY